MAGGKYLPTPSKASHPGLIAPSPPCSWVNGQRAQYVEQNPGPADRVAAVDPNRATLAACSLGDISHAVHLGGAAQKTANYTLSLKRWRDMAQITPLEKKRLGWKRHANDDIKPMLTCESSSSMSSSFPCSLVPFSLVAAPSFKSQNPQSLQLSCVIANGQMAPVLGFYTARRWRRARWHAHISRESAFQKVSHAETRILARV